MAKYVYLFGKRPVRRYATIRIALIFTNVHFDTPSTPFSHFFLFLPRKIFSASVRIHLKQIEFVIIILILVDGIMSKW